MEWNAQRIPLFQCFSILEKAVRVLPLRKDTLMCETRPAVAARTKVRRKPTRPPPQHLSTGNGARGQWPPADLGKVIEAIVGCAESRYWSIEIVAVSPMNLMGCWTINCIVAIVSTNNLEELAPEPSNGLGRFHRKHKLPPPSKRGFFSFSILLITRSISSGSFHHSLITCHS